MLAGISFELFIIFVYYSYLSVASAQLNCTSNNTNIDSNSILNPKSAKSHVACPINSQCTRMNSEIHQCICQTNFEWNPLWQHSNINSSTNSSSLSDEPYCRNATKVTTATVTTSQPDDLNNTKKIYVRPPPSGEHLAFGILMVLFLTISVVAFLYLLKVLRPIKRTKVAYTQLKMRRANRRRLSEHDEISMVGINES